jgi:hypothetical protein
MLFEIIASYKYVLINCSYIYHLTIGGFALVFPLDILGERPQAHFKSSSSNCTKINLHATIYKWALNPTASLSALLFYLFYLVIYFLLLLFLLLLLLLLFILLSFCWLIFQMKCIDVSTSITKCQLFGWLYQYLFSFNQERNHLYVRSFFSERW